MKYFDYYMYLVVNNFYQKQLQNTCMCYNAIVYQVCGKTVEKKQDNFALSSDANIQ